MPRKVFNLKDDDGKGKGRTYDHSFSNMPGGINIEEVALGMRLASLAITDNEPGTLEAVGKLNPWHIQALGMITGTVDQAHRPLSEILYETLGFTLDRNISCSGLSITGHFVDVQGYIAHNEQELVLAYRCTTSAFDWLTNFNAGTSEFEPEVDIAGSDSGCCSCLEGRWSTKKPRVHTGFYNDFLASAQDIEELIEPHLKPDAPPRRLFIVGHSLGAGVATVAYMYLLFKFDWATLPHKLLLVTAGGPRVVDSRLRNKVQDEVNRLRPLDRAVICRVVNRDDIVPTLPPEAFGFQHLDKVVYITDEMKVLVNPNLDERDIVAEQKDKKALKDQVDNTVKKVDGITSRTLQTMASGAASAQQVFVENYDRLLANIPSQLKDHMPDLYLEPLEHQWKEVAPVRLRIIGARALRNADKAFFGNKSDPYCVCQVLGKPTLQLRTPTINRCLDPEWNFMGELNGVRRGDELEFVVWDEDTLKGPDLLGKARLAFDQFRPCGFSGELELTDTGNKDSVQSIIKLEVS